MKLRTHPNILFLKSKRYRKYRIALMLDVLDEGWPMMKS